MKRRAKSKRLMVSTEKVRDLQPKALMKAIGGVWADDTNNVGDAAAGYGGQQSCGGMSKVVYCARSMPCQYTQPG